MDIEQLLTLPEAARLAGVNSEVFRYFVNTGRVPVAYQRGKFKFFDKAIISTWKPVLRKIGRPNKEAPNV